MSDVTRAGPPAMSPAPIFARPIGMESAGDRGMFLEEACRGVPELRRAVEDRVRDHFRAGAFLERAAGHSGTIAAESVSEGHETVTGPHKQMEQIGEADRQATGPAVTPPECLAQPR